MVTITLDKERTFKLTLNAMVKFEEITGKSLAEVGKDMKVKELRTFLWLGLLHEDKTLTEEQVGDLITAENMGEITALISASVGKAGVSPLASSGPGPNVIQISETPNSGA